MSESKKKEITFFNTENKEIKKLKVISLFSGSGGLDFGFLSTNKYEIVIANDFNENACKTYAYNIGNHILCCDISKLEKPHNADVLIGGPPCQGFSTANPSRSFDDPRNQLFKEYSKIIKEVKPKLFLMENVSGMVTMNKGKVYKLIKKELSDCGYVLYDKILNAKDYGTPQNRQRIIIIGVRNDINLEFEFPNPTHNKSNYITVGETIIDNKVLENTPNHLIGKITELNYDRLLHIPEGGSMKNCPKELQNNSDLNRAMRRLDSKKVSHTIVHNNCDHYYHPIENRRITIREMARLQGYPDNFIFLGSKSEQSKQVGNSVPIQLSKVLADSIFNFINKINI